MTETSYSYVGAESADHPQGTTFHIVSLGWGAELITGILDQIEAATRYRFSHIVLDPQLAALERGRGLKGVYRLRDYPRGPIPDPDPTLLTSLERPDIPTIHNMVMSDRVVRRLAHDDALAYATHLARRLLELFQRLKPSAILGEFDNLHTAIGLAVARRLGIPWFAMNFTPLPKGMSGFCTGLVPSTAIRLGLLSPDALLSLAERTLTEFERKERAVPAYVSANSMSMVIKRLPQHVRALYQTVTRWLTKRGDRFTEFPVTHLVREYVRKRANLFTLPRGSLCKAPPPTPYVFFGLHMQPESSIDVWAPFYSNQLDVVEWLARSVPPTHHFLVKLHKSDADNYSHGQLERFKDLPGVRLVSPFTESRPFLQNASLVVAIQGTMALEASLLGKPVIMFGDSNILDMPSVTRVGPLHELPRLVQRKLCESRPAREEIIRGFASYLSCYAPGCYNDWSSLPSPQEIGNLTVQFEALRSYLVRQKSLAT